MTFEAFKATQTGLEKNLAEAGKLLDAFPKGFMGLTSDSVKATPEYKLAKLSHNVCVQALRKFNMKYLKNFKKQISAEIDLQRTIKTEA